MNTQETCQKVKELQSLNKAVLHLMKPFGYTGFHPIMVPSYQAIPNLERSKTFLFYSFVATVLLKALELKHNPSKHLNRANTCRFHEFMNSLCAGTS